MSKRLIFTLIFIIQLLTSYSQTGQKILIYAERSDYLMPLIEKKLSEIKYLGKNNKILSKITNLNRITSNITSEKVLNEAVKYHSGLNISLTDSMKKTQNTIVDLIKVNELFLQIKINPLNNLLEYQFFLYKISSSSFPIINTSEPLATFNTFIDIQKDNYEKKVEDAIKSIFPKSNASPISKIEVVGYSTYNVFLDRDKKIQDALQQKLIIPDTLLTISNEELLRELKSNKTTLERRKLLMLRFYNVIIDSEYNTLNLEKDLFENEKTALKIYNQLLAFAKKEKLSLKELGIEPFKQLGNYIIDTLKMKRIYVSLNEPFILSPFQSTDYDTPNSQLKYSWRYWGTDEMLFSKDFISEVNNGECKVTLFSKKSSMWELTVSDGITESKDTLTIIPQSKKTLFIPQQKRSFLIYRHQTLFRQKEIKIFNTNDYSINIYTEQPKEIDEKRLFFSTIKKTFDTLNQLNFLNRKLSVQDKNKIEFSTFDIDENKIKLKFSHFKNAEGRYRVVYYDKGMKYNSNDIDISRVSVGIFSINYFYNFSNIFGNKFSESEYSLSLRFLRLWDIYSSVFQTNSLSETNTFAIKQSYEFGIKNSLGLNDMLPLKKNILDISQAIFYKTFEIQNPNNTEIKGTLGLSYQLNFVGILKKRLVYNVMAGYKFSSQVSPEKNRDYTEDRKFIGLGIFF